MIGLGTAPIGGLYAPVDDETSEDMPEPDPEPTPRHKSSKSQAAEPDIRPEADSHNNSPRPSVAQPEKRRNFFDFFIISFIFIIFLFSNHHFLIRNFFYLTNFFNGIL